MSLLHQAIEKLRYSDEILTIYKYLHKQYFGNLILNYFNRVDSLITPHPFGLLVHAVISGNKSRISDGKLTASMINGTLLSAKAIFETLILSRMDTMRAVRQEMNFDGL